MFGFLSIHLINCCMFTQFLNVYGIWTNDAIFPSRWCFCRFPPIIMSLCARSRQTAIPRTAIVCSEPSATLLLIYPPTKQVVIQLSCTSNGFFIHSFVAYFIFALKIKMADIPATVDATSAETANAACPVESSSKKEYLAAFKIG